MSRPENDALKAHDRSVEYSAVKAAQLLLGVDLGSVGPALEPASKRHKPLQPQSGPNSNSHDTPTHSILELGWRPLCRVRCNRLEGELLGGHDREVFVRCVSVPYVRLPDTALEQGGRIMTCSQFERVAGRELSKKWKESIHVMGYGEGSRATLASWLRDQASSLYGEAIIGRPVLIRWLSDSKDHKAWVSGFSSESGRHTMIYEEGQMVEQLHLPLEKMELLQVETGGSGGVPTLLHQHSGVSDSSTDGGTVEKIRKPSIQSRTFLVQEDSKKFMGRHQRLRNPVEDPALPQPNSQTIQAYQPTTVSDQPIVRPSLGTGTATEEDRLRWMHRLSIAVDHAATGNVASIGSRFQALLALQHGQPCLEGLFLALQTRLEETATLDLETRVARLRDFMEAAVSLVMNCQTGSGEIQ